MRIPRLRNPDPWELLLTLFITFIGIFLTGWIYINHVNQSSEQKLCHVVSLVNQAYDENQIPATPLGKELKQAYIDLYNQLGCKNVKSITEPH